MLNFKMTEMENATATKKEQRLNVQKYVRKTMGKIDAPKWSRDYEDICYCINDADNKFVVDGVTNIHHIRNKDVLVAMLGGTCMATSRLSDTGDYVILTDRIFEKSPGYVRNFVLQYHIGLIRTGIVDKMKDIAPGSIVGRFMMSSRSASSDITDADLYAMSITGYENSRLALTWILHHLNFGVAFDKEIVKRLIFLKKVNDFTIKKGTSK